MSLLGVTVFDAALNKIKDEAVVFALCDALPSEGGFVVSINTLASGPVVIDGPEDTPSPPGRRLVIMANGLLGVQAGTATHWAIMTEGSAVLLAAGELHDSAVIEFAEPYSLDTFYITLEMQSGLGL